ncbi:MAG: hypothetical protein ACK5MT_20535 [Actinomycetales bacterium]
MTIADGAPSTPLDGPLSAAAAELRTIGWRIFSAAWSTRADLRPLVLVGKGGVLVVGTHRTPDDLLALAAGTVTALLPARLRRAVVIENGQDRRSLPALAAALENRLDDAEILQITTALDRLDPARLVTTAHILEWTKDARPEPTRHSHRPLVGVRIAEFVTRHALLVGVIIGALTLLFMVSTGIRPAAESEAGATSSAVLQADQSGADSQAQSQPGFVVRAGQFH